MKELTNIEKQVLDLIERSYRQCYINRIQVTHNEDLYTLKLYLHDQQWCPLVIMGQCESDQDFLKLVEKEIKERNLVRSEHYKIQLHANN